MLLGIDMEWVGSLLTRKAVKVNTSLLPDTSDYNYFHKVITKYKKGWSISNNSSVHVDSKMNSGYVKFKVGEGGCILFLKSMI